MPEVICNVCGQAHPEAFPGGDDYRQGDDCACHLDGAEVRCHYGSSHYDTDIYSVILLEKAPPSGSVICDGCMKQLIESGVLVYQRHMFG